MSRKANALDAHIGAVLKSERAKKGLSQEDLATGLEITFQQIQKYEKATNRISASRLFELSKILQIPLTDFYTGYAAYDTQVQIFENGDPVEDYKDSIRKNDEGSKKLLTLAKEALKTKNPALINEIIEFIEKKLA